MWAPESQHHLLRSLCTSGADASVLLTLNDGGSHPNTMALPAGPPLTPWRTLIFCSVSHLPCFPLHLHVLLLSFGEIAALE